MAFVDLHIHGDDSCDVGLAAMFRGGDDTKSYEVTQEVDRKKKKHDGHTG
jgi:hypothetical protein